MIRWRLRLAAPPERVRELLASDAGRARPGWVSVPLALKAAADFGVDLRNHDPERTWEHGFVDN